MNMRFKYTTLAALMPMVITMTTHAAEPFALVELFTSEGCSSCPPADRVASELVDEDDGQNVFVLSFHVDYWDRLGWKDPYSTAAASERQRAYAKTLRDQRVYTPQMIVNGAVGFVGSDKERAEKEIERALQRPAPVEVVAEASTTGVNSVRIKARVEMEVELLHRNWDIVAAIVERDLSQTPDRGENKGRTLEHDHVVRGFDSVAMEGDGATVEIDVPGDVDREHASIIVYVQDTRTRKILGVGPQRVNDSVAEHRREDIAPRDFVDLFGDLGLDLVEVADLGRWREVDDLVLGDPGERERAVAGGVDDPSPLTELSIDRLSDERVLLVPIDLRELGVDQGCL
mgnify:CR=1 FL=1